MTYQTFVKKIGFGSKGYSLIDNSNFNKPIFFSGESINYSTIKEKLEKITDSKFENIKIGKQRNDPNEIKQISEEILKHKIDCIFVSGGGSIIDFVKNIFFEAKRKSKLPISFYIIPSRIGSGAEASIASIFNTKKEKIIKTNQNFLPDGIIYDLDFLCKLDKNQILLGSIDSITHCIESLCSFNKNPYLDFFSPSVINYFLRRIKVKDLISNKDYPKNILVEFCILSYNGGIAQNNAGSGICHALAHSAEKITGLPHNMCISFFILPTLNYINKTDTQIMNKFDRNLAKTLKIILKHLNKKLDFSKIEKIISEDSKLNKLIETAKDDPCWRLFGKTVNVNYLKNAIKKNYL